MYKIAAIIGGVLLMAGVALAGTVSSLGSPSNPTIGQTIPVALTTTTEQEPGDDRGREAEARGRAAEPGEDLRGPCDEAEHANDRRCTGTTTVPAAGDDRGRHSGRDDHGRHDGRGGDDSGSGHGRHGGDD